MSSLLLSYVTLTTFQCPFFNNIYTVIRLYIDLLISRWYLFHGRNVTYLCVILTSSFNLVTFDDNDWLGHLQLIVIYAISRLQNVLAEKRSM